MRKVLLFAFCCLFNLIAFSQDIKPLLQQAAELEKQFKLKDAFYKYKAVLGINPNVLEAQLKCSELCSSLGKNETTQKSRDEYFALAEAYAKNSLMLAPKNAEANVAMAIAKGRQALTKSGKEKVAAVKDIKRYAELALSFDPKNFKAWHIVGKWHYEVSNLSGVEKLALKVFYGGLPKYSFAEAVKAFEMSKQYQPYFLLNYLELARAYKKNGQKALAKQTIDAMVVLPNATPDDEGYKTEAKKLKETL